MVEPPFPLAEDHGNRVGIPGNFQRSIGSRAVASGAADSPANRPRNTGLAKTGEPPDHEPMPSPVDPAVDQGIEPDREQEKILDWAEQEVANPRELPSEPTRLERIAGDPQPNQDE